MPATTNSSCGRAVLVTAFVAVFTLLSALGVWQLSRAEEKRARYAEFSARQAAAPLDFDALARDATLDAYRWRRVVLRGHYRDFYVVLDNRAQHGRPGYEVLTPFLTTGGRTVLIDRGWIPLPASRDTVPDALAPIDPLTVTGFIGDPPTVGIDMHGTGAAPEWLSPQSVRVQRVEPAALNPLLKAEPWPGVVYLDGGAPGALAIDWVLPGDGSARHRAYAVQWFAMAAVLAAIGAWHGYRGGRTQHG